MKSLGSGLPRRSRLAGFTLIELMIVVVIVAVLAAIAVPSYQKQVVRTYRSAAQSDLLGFSQAMEKYYALNFTYNGAVAGTIFPAESPLDSNNKLYDLEIFAIELTTTTYTLRAVPKSDSTQADDGALYIDHLGQRKWDWNDNGNPNDPDEDTWDAWARQ